MHVVETNVIQFSLSLFQDYKSTTVGGSGNKLGWYVTFFLESLPKKCQKVPFSNTYTEETQIEFSLFKRIQRSGSEVWQYTATSVFCSIFPFFKELHVLFGLVRQVGPLANLMTFKGHTSKKRKWAFSLMHRIHYLVWTLRSWARSLYSDLATCCFRHRSCLARILSSDSLRGNSE